ncbi:GGDEF domain-containing protein [Jiella mangrovi]|uniref:diguanylate cyclase n=1 Tax=Jiella mangrovi TaxID=2821407 RepID=A0ABS4BDP0_9HYPH|nr:GGDEF domain-containing protein [Jiella mangrovi]MBP0614864.1 GGDEF domain-containing protein [Jiella mangrovi]
MKVAKAELSVAFVVCAVVAASTIIYYNHALMGNSLTSVAGEGIRRTHSSLTFLALGLLGAAALAALFVILPLLRHHDRESGKLHSLTGLLKERSQNLEAAALTDPLTGMHNRRFFDEALKQFVQEFERIEKPLGLALIDLDHFKSINDTHGHDIGDEVLRTVAYCLFEHSRFHDVVARIGGEEFAVIAPNMDERDLRRFAEKLRYELSCLSVQAGHTRIEVTASIGIAAALPKDEPATIMKRADVKLYQAKQSGRNRVAA